MFRYIATKKGNTKKENKYINKVIHNWVCSDLVVQEEEVDAEDLCSS